MLELCMDESKKVRILFVNLRSDYGGGPSHMFDLVTSLSSSFEKYVACPIQKPFYNLYKESKILQNYTYLLNGVQYNQKSID